MAQLPSPCTGICTLDTAGRVCRGCLRTIDEIMAWPSLGEEGKRAVLARLEAVRAAGGRR